MDLFYPRALSPLIRHAWDTVDLFYPRALVPSYDMPGIQWTYSIPGPLVTSYDMPEKQWTFSIPGPSVTSYDMPGIQWTYSIPGLIQGRLILLSLYFPCMCTSSCPYPGGVWPTCTWIMCMLLCLCAAQEATLSLWRCRPISRYLTKEKSVKWGLIPD